MAGQSQSQCPTSAEAALVASSCGNEALSKLKTKKKPQTRQGNMKVLLAKRDGDF